MTKYCLHLEHRGDTWSTRVFSEDRIKDVANKWFNSRESLSKALQAVGLPGKAIWQLEEDAAEGCTASVEIEVQDNEDALASLKD